VDVRRLGLLVFGVAFVVLFVIVAIGEGVGNPGVPSGDVAVVESAPGDTGKITMDKFEHALEQAAAQASVKKAPKPGDPQYDELKETAMGVLFQEAWLFGLADEMGIEVSDKEAAAKLKELKTQSFKSPAEFKKVVNELHYTPADVNELMKLEIIKEKVQEQLQEDVPEPSKSEVEDYYEAAKDTQFKQPASRDVRLIQNKDKKKVEAAKALLEKDSSAVSWKRAAEKFSTDSLSKENGGERPGVTEGTLEEPLDADVFGAQEDQLIGPVKTKQGYTIFEVESSTPESAQELKAVESQIESTLAQRNEQEYIGAFSATFTSTWTDRTFCASGFVTEQCGNFQPSGHSSTAPEGCYEANPKGGLPEACPAPVFQLVPALPGSVSPLEPRGKPLPQRPRPAGPEKEEAAAALPEGIPAPAE
jgi:peptidyl-prolyl cis-trans isomerase C